eukprot:6193004-Pleurochrysis_carterae.AAC.1
MIPNRDIASQVHGERKQRQSKVDCQRFQHPPVLGTEHLKAHRSTFMMMSWIGKNKRGDKGFVKKSARLSALRTESKCRKLKRLRFLAHEKVVAVYVLRTTVMFRVIC